MPTSIFVNLPVKDVGSSMRFYEALGYAHNPQFTDETAACIVISDTISVMFLTHAKFKEFTPKEISDPSKACGALLSLSCESRSEVDDLVAKAIEFLTDDLRTLSSQYLGPDGTWIPFMKAQYRRVVGARINGD